MGNIKSRRLLTVRESAEYLGLSPQTLYNRVNLRSTNPFPVKPLKIGRSVRFDIQDLDRFIEDSKGRDN